MPIFEFRCKSCDAHFEILVRSSGEAVECPSCRSSDLSKLFSTFASKSASPAMAPCGQPMPAGGCETSGGG